MKKILFLAISLFFVFGCNENQQQQNLARQEENNDRLLQAVLWYQKSAENRAIYYQNYNFAKKIVSEHLDKNHDKPLAVITDIDETVLDNSPFEVELIRTGQKYSYDLWKKWTDKAEAKALPGAVEFSRFLKNNGVELFYISNRRIGELIPTVENLKKEGFAFADTNHVLLKTNTSDKTMRRNKILQNYEVILFLGDNLRDFDEIFKDRTDSLGFKTVDDYKDLFGKKFIVFPNPMYGEWIKLTGDTVNNKTVKNFLINN